MTKTTAGALDRIGILVVDDNCHIGASIRRWLESEGACVIGPASTIAIARVLADVHTPRVAVIDLNLDGSSAYPLIGYLDGRGVPVIVSACCFAGEVTRNLGAILAKPIEKDRLIKAVRAALHAVPDQPRVRGRARQHLH